jgi:hypothetical protein
MPYYLHRTAKQNFAVRRSPEGGWEFDTPEEAALFEMRLTRLPAVATGEKPGGRAARKKTSSRKAAPKKAAPKKKATRKPRRRASTDKPREVLDPTAPVSFGQGKSIGCSVGNMKAYCSTADQYRTHAQALTAMGLNRGTASLVISALIDADVFRPHRGIPWDPEKGKVAMTILDQIGGAVCPPEHL